MILFLVVGGLMVLMFFGFWFWIGSSTVRSVRKVGLFFMDRARRKTLETLPPTPERDAEIQNIKARQVGAFTGNTFSAVYLVIGFVFLLWGMANMETAGRVERAAVDSRTARIGAIQNAYSREVTEACLEAKRQRESGAMDAEAARVWIGARIDEALTREHAAIDAVDAAFEQAHARAGR